QCLNELAFLLMACFKTFFYLSLSLFLSLSLSLSHSPSLFLSLSLSLSLSIPPCSPSLFRSLGLGNGRLPSKCYRVMGDSLKFPTEFMHLLSAFLFSPHKEETMLHGKEDLGCACNRTVTKEELNYTRS